MSWKVCFAPKGGCASFHFAAAQGAIGASSGFLPKGSDESQVLMGMPSGLGVQMPERSGIWELAWVCLDFGAALWAASRSEEASTATKANAKQIHRFRIMQLLDSSCSAGFRRLESAFLHVWQI